MYISITVTQYIYTHNRVKLELRHYKHMRYDVIILYSVFIKILQYKNKNKVEI
jgi:hypothetical protein